MKIRAEVTAVEARGDRISVRAQGNAASDPEWKESGAYAFEAPVRYAAVFHVGRIVTIEITPE